MWTVNSICRVIGIQHPSDHPTCIGYGKQKPTCGNLAAASSRDSAVRKLERICDHLNRGLHLESLIGRLVEAAGLLHCKRWHQYQAQKKADDWYDRLLDHIENPINEAPDVPEDLSNVEDEDVLGEIEARLLSEGGDRFGFALWELLDGLLKTARDCGPNNVSVSLERYMRFSRRSSDPEPSSGTRASASHARVNILPAVHAAPRLLPPAVRSLSSTTAPSLSSFSNLSAVSSLPSLSDHSDVSSVASVSSSPGLSSPRSISSRSSQASVVRPSHRGSPTSLHSASTSTGTRASSRSASISSSAGDDCGVCLRRMSDGVEHLWHCSVCRNATHEGCFDMWMARSAENATTCIYCRSLVQ
jgi:hypothetical protein